MTSLYPPNCDSLSDSIIGGVIQRAASCQDGSAFNTDATATFTTIMTKFTGHKRSPRHFGKTVSATKARHGDNVDRPDELLQQLLDKRDRRRERCRANQARYRNKQREHELSLEEEVQHLREVVQQLEEHRVRVECPSPAKTSIWSIAAEYFRLFRHGYVESTTSAISQSHLHLDFLQASMTFDVRHGTSCGVDSLLENWRLLTLYHPDICIELKCLEEGAESASDAVVAAVSTSFTITESTIRLAYPHLERNRHGKFKTEWTSLADRLLNQRVEMRGSVRFGWDETIGRVTTLTTQADLVTPMLKLVGSLKSVARVFEGANITLDGNVVVQ